MEYNYIFLNFAKKTKFNILKYRYCAAGSVIDLVIITKIKLNEF
jgi:hypothetical protein